MVGLSEAWGSWKTGCMRRRSGRTSCSGNVEMVWPSSNTEPAVGRTRHSTAFARVVLPLPDSPTSPSTSPRRSEKLTPSTAFTEPVS